MADQSKPAIIPASETVSWQARLRQAEAAPGRSALPARHPWLLLLPPGADYPAPHQTFWRQGDRLRSPQRWQKSAPDQLSAPDPRRRHAILPGGPACLAGSKTIHQTPDASAPEPAWIHSQDSDIG